MTVVVEAAQPSGSLITARQALDLGRELGAVPGPVTSRLSEGTNELIADGAASIRGAQDVLDRLLGRRGERTRGRRGPALEPELCARSLELVEPGSASCDAVADRRAIAAGEAAVALARLELLGLRARRRRRALREDHAEPPAEAARTLAIAAVIYAGRMSAGAAYRPACRSPARTPAAAPASRPT